jgi:hypothetical protein
VHRGRLALALVPALVLAAAAPTAAAAALPRTERVLVYGDSFVTESARQLRAALGDPGRRVTVEAWPGTALCDWLPRMVEDATTRPRLVVIAFAGGWFTPCMHGRGIGAAWAADTRLAAAFYASHGVRVLWASPPGAVGTHDRYAPVTPAYRAAAQEFGQRFVDAGSTLQAADGSWPVMLSCRAAERGTSRCRGDRIQVRRALTNGHLCPVHPRVAFAPCPTYSSGITRWAAAIAAAAR